MDHRQCPAAGVHEVGIRPLVVLRGVLLDLVFIVEHPCGRGKHGGVGGEVEVRGAQGGRDDIEGPIEVHAPRGLRAPGHGPGGIEAHGEVGVMLHCQGVVVGAIRPARDWDLKLLARAGPRVVARKIADMDVSVVGLELPRLVVPLHRVGARDPRARVRALQVRVRLHRGFVRPEACQRGCATGVVRFPVPVLGVVDEGIDALWIFWSPGGSEVAGIHDVAEELFAQDHEGVLPLRGCLVGPHPHVGARALYEIRGAGPLRDGARKGAIIEQGAQGIAEALGLVLAYGEIENPQRVLAPPGPPVHGAVVEEAVVSHARGPGGHARGVEELGRDLLKVVGQVVGVPAGALREVVQHPCPHALRIVLHKEELAYLVVQGAGDVRLVLVLAQCRDLRRKGRHEDIGRRRPYARGRLDLALEVEIGRSLLDHIQLLVVEVDHGDTPDHRDLVQKHHLRVRHLDLLVQDE